MTKELTADSKHCDHRWFLVPGAEIDGWQVLGYWVIGFVCFAS